MYESTSTWFMIGLNLIMIAYTLWVLSLARPATKLLIGIGVAMAAWLTLLHLGISTKSMFPADISGVVFLMFIFAYVGVVGVVLFVFPPVRRLLTGLGQERLLLFQGIRVFYGAGFLMQAGLGLFPKMFGIWDGWTHIAAGFFGLVAAFSVASGINGLRRAWFANLFGLTDILVVASTIALVLLPDLTPHHSMMYALFFPAPLFLWFHVISLWKLVRDRSAIPQEFADDSLVSHSSLRSAS